jgi:hypothetical protein
MDKVHKSIDTECCKLSSKPFRFHLSRRELDQAGQDAHITWSLLQLSFLAGLKIKQANFSSIRTVKEFEERHVGPQWPKTEYKIVKEWSYYQIQNNYISRKIDRSYIKAYERARKYMNSY